MDFSLAPADALALFGALAVLASVPSLSVMLVVARAATFGFRHGVATAAGIVLADLALMMIAILGLAVLAQSMEGLFPWVKLIGAAYLLAMGVRLWRARLADPEVKVEPRASMVASLVAGFALTLADQKAILFYLAFFPAFVDLGTLTRGDVAMIVVITIVAVGGAKVFYALFADRMRTRMNPEGSRGCNRFAAVVMIAVGIAVVLRG